jgi:AbrB family looped-hinge helix DNA binding protein
MKVSSDYRLTVPAKIRRALGMLPGTEVEFVIRGDEVQLTRVNTKRPLELKPEKKTVERFR